MKRITTQLPAKLTRAAPLALRPVSAFALPPGRLRDLTRAEIAARLGEMNPPALTPTADASTGPSVIQPPTTTKDKP